jgi:hypothetical protein
MGRAARINRNMLRQIGSAEAELTIVESAGRLVSVVDEDTEDKRGRDDIENCEPKYEP